MGQIARWIRWSRAEEDTIRLWAGKVTDAQISRELGRTTYSVRNKIRAMKKCGAFTSKGLTKNERIERLMWLSERCG
jgi:DNA-binding CsgD family transcriptional regulator